jgi:hypothetical protein
MNVSNFERKSILPDGNCFFRCVSSFINKKLLDSDRFKNGKIKNRDLSRLETSAAMCMRTSVCEKMLENKNKYKNEIYYDGELYNSIEDRIEQMKTPGEFAGLVEIKSASKLLKLCFNIYVPVYSMDTCEVMNYNLISKIGSSFNNECHIVLENNHYEILIKKTIEETSIKTNINSCKNPNTKKVYEKSDRVLRKKETIKYY